MLQRNILPSPAKLLCFGVASLLLNTQASFGQSTSAVFDDFSLGNRTHNGSPNNVLWTAVGGGNSGSYNWQTLGFPGTAMIDDHSRPASEVPRSIVNLTAGVS